MMHRGYIPPLECVGKSSAYLRRGGDGICVWEERGGCSVREREATEEDNKDMGEKEGVLPAIGVR